MIFLKQCLQCNPDKKHNILMLVDVMIVNMLSNKKRNPNSTRIKKLNISLIFITKSHFSILTNIRPNSIHYLVLIISNKQEFKKIGSNHSSISYENFMNLYKIYTAKPYSFLAIDNAPASDNTLCFRANLLEKI